MTRFDVKKKALDRQRLWVAANPEKVQAAKRKWLENNRDASRANVRRYHSGFSKELFEKRLLQQGNVCALCRGDFKGRPCADHDYELKIPRGILCHKCNIALGMFDDSPILLKKAIDYILMWKRG